MMDVASSIVRINAADRDNSEIEPCDNDAATVTISSVLSNPSAQTLERTFYTIMAKGAMP